MTSDGVVHTWALPDWRDAFDPSWPGPGAWTGRDRRLLEAGLEELEDALYDEFSQLTPDPLEEARFTETTPPPLLVGPTDASSDQVAAVLRSIRGAPLRWRLDYVMAAQDACDDVE